MKYSPPKPTNPTVPIQFVESGSVVKWKGLTLLVTDGYWTKGNDFKVVFKSVYKDAELHARVCVTVENGRLYQCHIHEPVEVIDSYVGPEIKG